MIVHLLEKKTRKLLWTFRSDSKRVQLGLKIETINRKCRFINVVMFIKFAVLSIFNIAVHDRWISTSRCVFKHPRHMYIGLYNVIYGIV